MKYAIYFEVQGYKDTFNVKSAKERDMCLKELLRNDAEYKNICWCNYLMLSVNDSNSFSRSLEIGIDKQ